MNQEIVIGTLPEIEALQIYTAPQVDAFAGRWLERGIDYLRFERVTLPGSRSSSTGFRRIFRPTNTACRASTAGRCLSTPTRAKECIRTGER